jgi:hypothetical protein
MKSQKLAAFAVIGLLLTMSWTIARADQNGDDAVFCCSSINPAWDSGNPGFTAQMLGCVAIDGSLTSINSCARAGNYVLGCTESGFACVPSQACAPRALACAPSKTSSGQKDCACGNFISSPFN